MSDLVVAAFGAETGSHVVERPNSAGFREFSRRFEASSYLERLRTAGVRWLARTAAEFPPLLRSIHDPPPGLFLRDGQPAELLSRAAVAVVGARSCSPYGAEVARMLGRELGASGLVVVSGLARGVDGEAHRGALE
jgi:DNA processing protein